MAKMKVITPAPSLSHTDIIEFVRNLLEYVRENPTTSVGVCMCCTENGQEITYIDSIITDPGDQDNFEFAALELRHRIIDGIDDLQFDFED